MKQTDFDTLVQSSEATRTQIPANQTLFSLGDECDHYVVVESGTVRVELLSTTGQQLLLYRIHEGQSCVMTTSCLLGKSRYFAQAISETPISLILIPQSVFRAQLIESTKFRDFIFEGFSERLAALMERTVELATSSVDHRLASSLLANMRTESSGASINLTHEQLAVEIGSAREVVSRRLAAFENQGLVIRHRGHIEIVNTENLIKRLSNS